MKASLIVTTLAFALVAPPAVGATFFVSGSGNDGASCSAAQSGATPKKTLGSALACLSPGSTLVLADGTYSGSANAVTGVPNGAAGSYVTVKAEHDGQAVITAGLSLDHTNSYLRIEGLRFEDTQGRTVVGNHLKFLRTGFKGGCATGNCTNTTVGSNNYNDTADILFEDCWFHGAGGRYNLLVYNSDRVVVRRAVIRHDGAWDDLGSADPEAGLMFYNSASCAAQNVVVLDSNEAYKTWAASFYAGKNSSVPHPNQDNSWTGCLALVGANVGMRLDGDISNASIQDCALWDTTNGGISFGTGNTSATVNRVTVGRSKLASSGDFQGGIGGWGAGSKGITNAILAHWTSGSDLNGVSATYFDTFDNQSTATGTGRVTVDPQANGLDYLVRIEAGGALATAGSGGTVLGATLVTRVGSPEALEGETGWNVDTGVSLWPWPFEDRIREELCTAAGISRGFCGDSSLTHYVLNYLGNGNPYPSAPYDGGTSADAGGPDAGGTADAGLDAGGVVPDAGGVADAGLADAGSAAPDAGAGADAGLADAGGVAPDAGAAADAGLADAGSAAPDGGSGGTEAGPVTGSGCGCSGTGAAPAEAVVLSVLFAMLGFRRRAMSRGATALRIRARGPAPTLP